MVLLVVVAVRASEGTMWRYAPASKAGAYDVGAWGRCHHGYLKGASDAEAILLHPENFELPRTTF